jgi:hypothetical protein
MFWKGMNRNAPLGAGRETSDVIDIADFTAAVKRHSHESGFDHASVKSTRSLRAEIIADLTYVGEPTKPTGP